MSASLPRLQSGRQVDEALWQYVALLQCRPDALANVGGDGHILAGPPFELRMHGKEAVGARLQRICRANQTFGVALAGAEANSLFVFVHRHEVDFDVGAIPITTDALAEREVANTQAAALLV